MKKNIKRCLAVLLMICMCCLVFASCGSSSVPDGSDAMDVTNAPIGAADLQETQAAVDPAPAEKICSVCYGTGTCPVCNGAGIVKDPNSGTQRLCTNCTDGRCQKCGGTGKIDGGPGLPKETFSAPAPETAAQTTRAAEPNGGICSVCYGTGKCPTCSGTALVLDPGTGNRQACPNCTNGLCPGCNGSGLAG